MAPAEVSEEGDSFEDEDSIGNPPPPPSPPPPPAPSASIHNIHVVGDTVTQNTKANLCNTIDSSNQIDAAPCKPGAVSVSINKNDSIIHSGGAIMIPTKGGLKAPMPPMIPDFCQNHHHGNNLNKKVPPPFSPPVKVSYTPGCVVKEENINSKDEKSTQQYAAPSSLPTLPTEKRQDDNKPSYIAYLDDNDGDGGNEASHHPTYLTDNFRAAMPRERATTVVGACPVAGPGVPISQTSFIIGSSTPSNILYSTVSEFGGTSSKSSFQFQQRSSMLVEAMPVVSTQRINAQPVDDQILEVKEARDKGYKRLACCLVVVVCLVLTVSVAFLLSNNNNSSIDGELTNDGTNASIPHSATTNNKTLPPSMVDLELLYFDLPETTRENIFLSGTPQNQAWEWLLDHPNITNLEEWRKKQIFALTTFYYALGGPRWPESFRKSWLNSSTSECYWVFFDTKDGVTYWFQQSQRYLGRGAYQRKDFYSCNKDGKLQTIVLKGLRIPKPTTTTTTTATGNNSRSGIIPAEISLLASLKILIVSFGQTNAKLSDMLVPEITELPRLQLLALQDSGLWGTMPKEIGTKMTSLRHLTVAANKLTGSMPLAGTTNLSSLENLILANTDIAGRLPSEVGLLTRLTGLDVAKTSLTGPIPSQLGLLSGLKNFRCFESKLSSLVPTQLGLMTNMRTMLIQDNSFNGQIPSQLGLMTSAVEIVLGNTLELQGSSSYCNNFSGSLPNELWQLSRLKMLSLSHLPHLSGSIPTKIVMPNLTTLSLDGTPHLSGTIPDQACIFVDELNFDCTNLLCGCDCGCAKVVSHTNNDTILLESSHQQQSTQDEQEEVAGWPGLFPPSPTINNPSNAITLNIRTTDRYQPDETRLVWSARNGSGLWTILDSDILQEPEQVHTYTKEVQSNLVYRLELFNNKHDDGDGSSRGSCCSNSISWLTITNSTPSTHHQEGTILWEASGSVFLEEEGMSSFHVYLWVDSNGGAKVLEHLTGPRRS